ncbi:hypothetical protein RintRC_6763 [Richelia intracellularis]|nr:hypothetical protein RintRC_6763 [Richelia intracellularis]
MYIRFLYTETALRLEKVTNRVAFAFFWSFLKNKLPAKAVESRYPIWATVDFAVI